MLETVLAGFSTSLAASSATASSATGASATGASWEADTLVAGDLMVASSVAASSAAAASSVAADLVADSSFTATFLRASSPRETRCMIFAARGSANPISTLVRNTGLEA